jgi:NADH dehydrogenase/NADH:ubiquinone oxidoreductase subunit G
MTRCIHCTRCVRFGQDIAGIQEMGATGRGEHMEIGTFIEHSVDHELSGNIIDLCPVGALNSKPFRYRGRGWEMTQYPLISPHDGVGTQLYGHVLRGRLMRVVPRPCEEINETWIADRDRFSYEGIYSEDRLLAPQLRQADGSWREVEWDVALAAAAQGLQGVAREAGGVGLLAHPSSTLEELYLLARLAEGLGSANIDHRLRQRDFRDQAPMRSRRAWVCRSPRSIKLDALLVVGSNLRHELPILAHRVRKAALRGARISFINPAHSITSSRWRTRAVAAGAPGRGLAAVLLAALDGAAAPRSSAAAGRRERRRSNIARSPRRSRAASGARSGSVRWPRAAAATASCGHWRARWRRRAAPAWANWPRAAMRPAPIWPARCRIAAPAARARRARDARRGRCSSRRCRAICCSTPSPGRTRRCRGAETLARARCVVAVTPMRARR